MPTNVNPVINIGVAAHIGKYSDAVEIPPRARWLFTSGTPGLTPEGHLPATFELQAEQAWKNILLILQRGGMSVENLVKIVQYLVRPQDLAVYAPIRVRFLGDCRPASMLLVAAALPRPDFLIEIEATAAAPE